MSELDQEFVAAIASQLEAKVKDHGCFSDMIINRGRNTFLDHMAEAIYQCTNICDGFTPDDEALTIIAANRSLAVDTRTAYRKSRWVLESVSSKSLSDENIIDLAHAAPSAPLSVCLRKKIQSGKESTFLELFNVKCDQVEHAWFLRDEPYANTFLIREMIESHKKVPGVKYLFKPNGIENSSFRPIHLTSVHESLSKNVLFIKSIVGDRGSVFTPLLSMLNNINSEEKLYSLKDESLNIERYSQYVSVFTSLHSVSKSDRDYAREEVNRVLPEIIKKSIYMVIEFRKSYCGQEKYDVMAALKKVMLGLSIINSDSFQPTFSISDDFVKCTLETLSKHSDLVAESLPILVRIRAVKNKDYLPLADTQWKCSVLSGLVTRDQILSSDNKIAKGFILENDLGM